MFSIAAKDAGIVNQDNTWWATEWDVGISFNRQMYVVVVDWDYPTTVSFEINKDKWNRRRKKEFFKWDRFENETVDETWKIISEDLPESFYDMSKSQQLEEVTRIIKGLYTKVKLKRKKKITQKS